MKNEEIKNHLRDELKSSQKEEELRSARKRIERLEAEAEGLKAAMEAKRSRAREEDRLRMELDEANDMLEDAKKTEVEQVERERERA